MRDDAQQLDLEAAPPRLYRSRHRKAAMLLLISGGVPALATFLGFLGLLWWPFDILANYRPQYALILVGVMLALFVTKRFLWGLLLLLPIALNVVLIVPLYIPTDQQIKVQERMLIQEQAKLAKALANGEDATPVRNTNTAQIIRYDEEAKVMRDGLMWHVSDEPLMIMNLDMNVAERGSEHVMNLINDGQADIILAQSITESTLKQLSMHGTPYRIHNSMPQDDDYGIAMLSRVSLPPKIRITASDTISLTNDKLSTPAITATVLWYDRQFQLLMVHLPGPWSPNGAKQYKKHIDGIVTWVNAQDDPVVVMGNFNATPWSAHFSDLLQKTGLNNSQIGFGIQPTWPASGGFPIGEIPVDHCLHSEQLVTVERGMAQTNGADHRPLIVKLNWLIPQEKPTKQEQAQEEQALIDAMKQKRQNQLDNTATPKKKKAAAEKKKAEKKKPTAKPKADATDK
ncbi:MAG: endonuclease/exonuclease/phosphatase family protein [Phycisphaeraceae bacterium JB051]